MKRLLLLSIFCFPILALSQPVNYYSLNFANTYATWDIVASPPSGFLTYSQNNTVASINITSGGSVQIKTTATLTRGKWYAEFLPQAGTTAGAAFGFVETSYSTNGFILGGDAAGRSWSYQSATGKKVHSNVGVAYGATFTIGDTVGVALDMDNGFAYFSKNGVWQNSGVPTSGSTGTGAAFSGLSGTTLWMAGGNNSASGGTFIRILSTPKYLGRVPPSGYGTLRN